MAIRTEFVDGQPAKQGLGQETVVASNKLDFSVINVAASDIVQALKIPAGALITNVWVEIDTVEGGVATADIGDTDDPNGWDDAVDFDATAGDITKTLEGTDAYATGRRVTAADTIDIVPDDALDTAVIIVFAEYSVQEAL